MDIFFAIHAATKELKRGNYHGILSLIAVVLFTDLLGAHQSKDWNGSIMITKKSKRQKPVVIKSVNNCAVF